jgi:DNA-binding winged helix-turn-helix (wHTH) protein
MDPARWRLLAEYRRRQRPSSRNAQETLIFEAIVRIAFGDYEFDPGRRVLVHHGRDTTLSPKAFQFLELLLDRRPDAVSKSELLERLWPDTFVSDASLHNLVAEVRSALRDDARMPRYVRTIPRYGYAFHGETHLVHSTTADMSQQSARGPRLVSRGRDWVLADGANVVGRDRECAVRIDDRSVSRQHARITVSSEKTTIEDLGSKNGTFVNGARVGEDVVLEDGAKVRIGSVSMIYRMLEALPSTRTLRRV